MVRKFHNFSNAGIVLLVLFSTSSWAGILSDDWEKFFQEKVSFSGFVENTSGVAVGKGSHFFNTSNRFVMNRFTIQPEFNVDMADWSKFFISWRFVRSPAIAWKRKAARRALPTFRRDRSSPWSLPTMMSTVRCPGKPFGTFP